MSLLSQPRRSFPSRTGMAEAMGMPSAVDMIDWRGHGGRHPTYSSVEFDRQLDKVAIWLENWDHEQVRKLALTYRIEVINARMVGEVIM